MKHSALVILLFFSLLTESRVNAQSPAGSPAELYAKLAELDSILFANVYTCNPDKNATFFTEDLEFYHDKGGLTRSLKTFMEGLEKNFCGGQNQHLRRELVKSSLKLCPINNYGALQTGEHRFYVTKRGQTEKLTGIAKFAHVWKLNNGEWKISRVLSYDHKEAGSDAPTVTKELYETIAHLDSLLSDAFNAHDHEKLSALFTGDLEFYHDKDGLSDHRAVDEGFRKMFDQNNGITRELVQGSFEVYPIKDYGAIERGAHQFCHVENGKNDCGTFPFIMIWQKLSEGWKISRVISYDH